MGQGSPSTEGKGHWARGPSLGQGGAGTRGVGLHLAQASCQVTFLGCAALIKGHSGLHIATSSGQFSSLCHLAQWSI